MANLDTSTRRLVGLGIVVAGAVTGNFTLVVLGIGLLLMNPSAEEVPGTTVTNRGRDEGWQIVYGNQRVGGTYTFMQTSGTNDELIHMVITLTGHPVQAINTMYFDGIPIPLDGNGDAIETPADQTFTFQGIDVIRTDAASGTVGLSVGQQIDFTTTGSLHDNLSVDKIYFIKEIVDGDDLKISEWFGGPTILWSGVGESGQQTLRTKTTIGYIGHVHVQKALGTDVIGTQWLDELDTAIGGDTWDDTHLQTFCAAVYVRLKWNTDKFPNGIPNITFDVQGKPVNDAAQGGVTFSRNPAKILADYLQDTDYGMSYAFTDIDNSAWSAAETACDVSIAIAKRGSEAANLTEPRYQFDGVLSSKFTHEQNIAAILSSMRGELYDIGGLFGIFPGVWRTEEATVLDEDDFAAILEIQNLISRKESFNAVRGKYRSAESGWKLVEFPPIWHKTTQTITSVNSGADTFNLVAHGRENGDILQIDSSTDDPPEPIIEGLFYYVVEKGNDTFKVSLTEGGTAVDLIDNGTGTIKMHHDPYWTADGERLWRDVQFPSILSPSQAQRIAKIVLEESRQTISVESVCRLAALEFQPPDNVKVTNSRMGWSEKIFKLTRGGLVIQEGGAIAYKTSLRETAEAIYTWDETVEETVKDYAPNTGLPSPFLVAPPTGLGLSSGTADLDIRLDGTIFSRIRVTWTAPVDEFVQNGGRVEIEYAKFESGPPWLVSGSVPGTTTEAFILDVADGEIYDVRIRSVNTLGVHSDWVESTNHTVIGKTEVPEDVTGFAVIQNGDSIVFVWNSVSDIDLAGYILKYELQTDASWETATLLSDVSRLTTMTTLSVPPGTWTFFIKAIDTSGNESATEATHDLVVTTSATLITSRAQEPDWWDGRSMFQTDDPVFGVTDQSYNPLRSLPTLTNFIRHRSGVLLVDDGVSAAGDNFDVFDSYLQDPTGAATSTFTTFQYLLPFGGTIRAYALTTYEAGPDEVLTNPDVIIEFREMGDDLVWSDWERISFGLKTTRVVQFRVVTTNTIGGLIKLTGLTITLDEDARIETGTSAVSDSGTVITFAAEFFETPRVTLSVNDGDNAYAGFTDRTGEGFTAFVYDSGGAAIAGNVDWIATNG